MCRVDLRKGVLVADPIDVHVGSRVRLRRTLMGLTQDGLARELGLTFQQIQKYERGSNRIGASRLMQLALCLDVTPGYFFEDMPAEITTYGVKGMAADGAVYEIDRSVLRRETLELVRCFYSINNSAVQARLRDLIVSIGDAGVGEP